MSSPETAEPRIEEAPSSPTIRLTPAAIEKVREMLEEEELLETGGLRITARHGAGCSAPLQFGMILEFEPGPGDEVLEGNGIRLFIDTRSSWSLDGLMVDYVDSPGMGEGFAFRHPRGVGGRAC
ncbi:MAG: iron-sulfur cluster assembly accessory protein [Gemmatimonadales bacterium]|nr:MAG: iron-sulfur cluster assembly accessory protein [Gemmatimonadales bacterium]